MKLAWIGTGVMGAPMLCHLKKSGYELHAYNRTYAKARPLKKEGIQIHQDIPGCIRDADIVITMVAYPKDVEEIYEILFAHAKKGCILIDMTTSSPSLARQLYEKGTALGLKVLDAPVSGGDSGAREGSLSIMVGGDQNVFAQVKPLLMLMGKEAVYMGKAGNGQHAKACNQIAVAGAVAAMSEALVYAKAHGLNSEALLKAIGKGAAGSWQLAHTAPRVLKQDFAPGFYIKHFIKDMHIVQEEMKDTFSLDMLNTVCSMYETLAAQGEENNGTQALIHYYKNKEKSEPL